jgi:uncharacterized repeat protein (TIGR01451 family)
MTSRLRSSRLFRRALVASMMALNLVGGAVAPLQTVPLAHAAPSSGLITGEIERLTITNATDVWSAGKMVVGGQNIIIPRNLLADLPANRLTLQQLFTQAPAACVANGESGLAMADLCNSARHGAIATVAGNRTNGGDVIAGDVFFQKGVESIGGNITYINYADGYFRLNGIVNDPLTGVMVRLNDPTSKHTVQSGLGCNGGPNCSADPRFTLDPDNYTNAFITGYPICLPSSVARTFTDVLDLNNNANVIESLTAQSSATGTGDLLCPNTNRTPNFIAADSRRFAPLQMGDHLTAEGNFETINGVRFLSAHTTAVQGGMVTSSGANQPDYMAVEEAFMTAPGYQINALGRSRDLFLGYATDPSADVVFYTLHRDPQTNAPHEFPLATSVGCDNFNGAGQCTNTPLPNGYRVRHTVFLGPGTNGPARQGDPCKELRADPRFGLGFCPNGGTAEEEFAVTAPIAHELIGRTGKKIADLGRAGGPLLKSIDVRGNDANNGQYVFPMGVGLGGLDMPDPLEFNLNATGTPFEFDGLGWLLDRRLSPNGCPLGCEATPQPLDPFPFPQMDPRTQVPVPTGPYNDPNYTASPLSNTANRILSFVDGTLGKFNGDVTLLAWPPVDPPAQGITPTPPLNLTGTDTTPPAAPTGLAAAANGTTRIDLSWSELDPSTVGYRIFRDGSTTALATLSGAAPTTYSDTTLTPGTTHSYSVASFDAAGNQSAPSASASATTATPPIQANLALSGTAQPDPVTQNAALIYTLTVVNNSAQAATGVTLVDTLPAGVTMNSINPSQGTCTNASGSINCQLGTLAGTAAPPGGSATVTISVNPPTPGVLTNRSTVSANEFDPDTTNNALSQQTTVNAAPAAATADLTVTHSPTPPNRARPGATFNYTLNVSNGGPQPATSVVLKDALSTTMVLQGVVPTQGTCSNSVAAGAAGGTVTCNLGTIAAGTTVSVVFVILTPAVGDATDAATVTSAEADPVPGNNSQTQTNRIH